MTCYSGDMLQLCTVEFVDKDTYIILYIIYAYNYYHKGALITIYYKQLMMNWNSGPHQTIMLDNNQGAYACVHNIQPQSRFN